jgi:hypothetical protein
MRAQEFIRRQLREDIENFPIANVRRPNGAIGNQGVNTEQAADVLTHAAGMQVSPDMTMRQLVDALKADPAAQQRLRQFVQKNPITVYALPDGSYHLQDGNHRTFLLNLLGDETVPAVVKEGVAEGTEQINEYRNRLLQYVKGLLPTYPEYVLKDWLVPNKGDFSNLPDTELKNGIMEKLNSAGLTPNTKWQLVPDMKFTMDMFNPMSKQRLIGRAGGHSDMGLDIPRDKERHATQAALARQQGGIRKEPVILIQTPQGYALLEGWHRTIQHFAMYPNGYTGPAYVAVANAVQENFHDGRNPGRKGLAKRSGVNTKASVSDLRKTAKNSSGEKQRMAHWLANMKAGRAKAKRK